MLERDPEFIRWYKDYQWGAEGERLTRAWAQALFEDDPDAIISNYGGFGPVENATGKPSVWNDGFYTEDNGRKRALDEFLRD